MRKQLFSACLVQSDKMAAECLGGFGMMRWTSEIVVVLIQTVVLGYIRLTQNRNTSTL